MTDLEQEIQSEADKQNVRQPTGEQRRQCAAASQSDGDGLSRPITESDNEGLADSGGHAAAANAASPQTQRDADQNHDHRHYGERQATVIVGEQAGDRDAFRLKPGDIVVDLFKGHRLGIARQRSGEIVGDKRNLGRLFREGNEVHGIVRSEPTADSVAQNPSLFGEPGLGRFDDPVEMECPIEMKQPDSSKGAPSDVDRIDRHQCVGSDADPRLGRLNRQRSRPFFDANQTDFFGLFGCKRDDRGTERQQDEREKTGEQEKRRGHPEQTDAAAPKRGDLVAAREQADCQKRGDQDGEGRHLERNGRDFEGEIHKQRHDTRIVAEKPADFFKEVDHHIDGQQPGETHQKNFDVFPQNVAKENRHQRPVLIKRKIVASAKMRVGAQAPANGPIIMVVTRKSNAMFNR